MEGGTPGGSMGGAPLVCRSESVSKLVSKRVTRWGYSRIWKVNFGATSQLAAATVANFAETCPPQWRAAH
jgi:hypothetical protein